MTEITLLMRTDPCAIKNPRTCRTARAEEHVELSAKLCRCVCPGQFTVHLDGSLAWPNCACRNSGVPGDDAWMLKSPERGRSGERAE